ncbi:MAG: ROK family protein [Candidatus Woesearchaeota archaeon]
MAGNKIIGVDLGGTYLRAGIVEGSKISNYIKIRTPMNKKDLLKALVDSISDLMDKDVKGIGVAAPGPLKDGIIKNTPNIPLKNFNLKGFLKKKFKKRVEVENDANCVALAEARLGVKKKNFIIFTLGTGIGGGIIINGEMYVGKSMAGEFGDMILDSEKNLEDLWKEKKIEIKDLFDKNDMEKLEKVSKFLGQGISSMISVFDPEIVVLAGGVKETGDKFLRIIRKHVKKYNIMPKMPPIVWSKLNHPGILGASLLIK